MRNCLDTWWNELCPSAVDSEEVTMSFFGKILEKLGFKTAKAEPAPAPKAPAPRVAPAPSAPPPPPPPKPIEVVDVVAQLEKLAAANPQKLNWKVSIVDLLKLLDIDSSFAARKELATELGCPAELMGDSARMNMWLHKTVLKKIADNGGNVPKELLD
jgi:3-oxoacyl-ACP reductase-like protein